MVKNQKQNIISNRIISKPILIKPQFKKSLGHPKEVIISENKNSQISSSQVSVQTDPSQNTKRKRGRPSLEAPEKILNDQLCKSQVITSTTSSKKSTTSNTSN